MKKYFYSFLFLASGIIMLSNSSGRGTVSGQGAAGAPGDGLTCASGNCHGSGGTFNASVDIFLVKDNEQVTEYRPGETYELGVVIISANGNPSRYGFQMTAVVDSDDSGAGTFSELESNVKSLELNNRTYLEHNGSSTFDDFGAVWTAPAEGTGAVTIYAAGIAANGNGGTSGDSGALNEVTITEADLSSIKVLSSDEMSFSPNPAKDFIFIDTKLNQSMVYDVVSVDGAKVASGNLENNAIDIL